MTSPQRPEWPEPNDDSKSRPKRHLPVLALSAAFTLIGAGAIFAQPQVVTVANTTGSVAVSKAAQRDSSVTPPILSFPAVTTISEGDEDFYGFDEDDFDKDEDEDDFDEDEDEEDD